MRNCVNDAPVLTRNITTQTGLEDNVKILNLREFFSDPDGDQLTFSVNETSLEENIMIVINGNQAIFTPKGNWNGESFLSFKSTDGNRTTFSNGFVLQVLPVNDAPVIGNISEVKIVEGSIARLVVSVTDPDGDNFTISYSSKLNAQGEWQTNIGDAGVYTINVIANDGKGGAAAKQATVIVIGKLLINEFVSNSITNEWVEIYNPGNNVNLSGFSLEDSEGNKKMLSGIVNRMGFIAFENLGFQLNNEGDAIILKLNNEEVDKIAYGNYDDGNINDNVLAPGFGESAGRDPDGTNNWIEFERPTKALPSNADVIPPTVELISPANAETFTQTRDVSFSFKAADNGNNIECGVFTNINGNFNYLNPKRIENNTISNIAITNIQDGNYIWNVRCTDGISQSFAPENRTFAISAPDAPLISPIENKIVKENQTLEFIVSATDQDGDSIVITTENLPENASFDSSLNKFSWRPRFNQDGEYKVRFIAKDSTNKTSSLETSIKVEDVEFFEFGDAETCDIIDRDIRITIENPDENDDFEIGDEVEVSVKIKNSADEDVDLDVNVYLYDLTDDEAVEDTDDDLSVDEKDTEELDFTLKIPDDLDLNNKFAVYVIAQEESDEFCNAEFSKIKIERSKEKLKIRSIALFPENPRVGDSVTANVNVRNIGTKDIDGAYLTLINEDLELDLKSERFDIEKFDDEDSEIISFNFLVSDDADAKSYPLEVKLYYQGLTENSTANLNILSGLQVLGYDKSDLIDTEIDFVDYEINTTPVNPVEFYEQKNEVSNGDLMNYILWIIDAVLILGILATIILIIVVVVRRSR
ncbi:MAG: Ig-like domain-containing protein [Nanoarchaeota archaeon]